jgi:hypothetical protein
LISPLNENAENASNTIALAYPEIVIALRIPANLFVAAAAVGVGADSTK